MLILGGFNVEIKEATIKYWHNFDRRSTHVDTGLSDFHLMTVTGMRKTFKKICPRVVIYGSYNNFSNETMINLSANDK